MKIVVIGSGYVGLVAGACFAEMGNTVVCVDSDTKKINQLCKGVIPIYEPGLDPLISYNIARKSLSFTSDLSFAIKKADIVMVCVGTPTGEDGSADLQYVLAVAKEIGQYMDHELVVVNKSTVPVGTADKVQETIKNELNKRGFSINFHMVSNPEFLKEGDAINDFMKPDRVVIGASSDQAFKVMRALYAPFFRTRERYLEMDIASAEMTKYAANAMLATKISFMNEIAKICEKVGADANQVRVGIGSDSRIGYDFIYPGIGFGGTCFPKDLSALQYTAEQQGIDPVLLKSVSKVNTQQQQHFIEKIIARFGSDLSHYSFAVWGLTFKPNTDDVRKSPAVIIIKELTRLGATITAYDPKGMPQAKEVYLLGNSNVEYKQDKYEVLDQAHALLLLTEWKEFRSPNFQEIKERLKTPIIFDGRNQYLGLDLLAKGFEYYRIGK